MAESLGQAQLQLTVAGYDDLIQKLANIKKELNGISSGPIKLQVDGTGTRSKTTSGDRAQGGARESLTAKTDAQSKRARLNQQLNSLEASGVKTTKLRAQLGEATTAQANRQYGTFNQIANKLSESLRAEREKLKIQKQQTRESEKQVTEEKRIGKGNASPIRGGIGFDKSPIALEVAARKQQRLAKDLDAGAMERAANRKAKIADRIDYLSTGGRDQSVRSAATPLKPNADAIKAEELLDKARKATAATTEKEAKRIAKDNASPLRGRIGDTDSPAFKAAEEKRKQDRITRRAEKIADRQDYMATGGRDQPRPPAQPIPVKFSPLVEKFLVNKGVDKPTAATRPEISGPFGRPDPAAIQHEKDRSQQRAKAELDAANTEQRAQRDRTRAQQKRRDGFNKKAGDVASNTLIGGGFPLLFGQGGGAAAGGAVGGALGGLAGGGFGFAGSIVGTALGAAFDTALEKGKALALGLDDPIGQFDKLSEAALFSSLAVEKQVGALIDSGRTEEAKIVAQGDLNATFGGAENAREFAAATDELNRAWAQAQIALADFVAGPMADFLKGLAAGLGSTPAIRTATQENKDAMNIVNSSPDKRQEFKDLAKSRGVNLDDNLNGDLGKRIALVKEFLALNGVIPAAQREQLELNARLAEASQRNLDINKADLDVIRAQTSGNQTAVLDAQETAINKRRVAKINSLGDTPDKGIRIESINVEANKELVKIDAERAKIQKDLNQALSEEFTRRAAIATQIKAAVLGQEAALARADAGANPGNSVLAARAGRAEGDAFKAQNQSGINAAKDNESQLRNQLRFEPDTSKQTELVDKIRTAAEATKLAYVEAGTALAEKIGAAAASLKGMRDSLRGTLEGNIDLLPGQDVQNLRNMAQADINRGQQNGILRSDLGPAQTDEEQFRRAGFVRSVENQNAQIESQKELIKALNDNAAAERNITVRIDPGGSPVPVGDRTASTL